MDTDLTTQLMTLQLGKSQQVAQIAIARKSDEMQRSLIETVNATARSAPAPEGQGLLVDRRA